MGPPGTSTNNYIHTSKQSSNKARVANVVATDRKDRLVFEVSTDFRGNYGRPAWKLS